MKTALKNTRQNSGLTQAKVANEALVTVVSYQRYEAGERVPNAHTAQLLARALNSTVEDLFPLSERLLREKQEKPGRGKTTSSHGNNTIHKKDCTDDQGE